MATQLTNDRWDYESNCFVCEPTNPVGLQIPFSLTDDRHAVTAEFNLGSQHSSAPALVHSGVCLAILNEAQQWAVVAIAARWALTRSTECTFDGGVLIDHRHLVSARVTDIGHKLVHTEASILDEGGVELARSHSSFTIVGIIDFDQHGHGLDPSHSGLLGDQQSPSAC